jgi:hypothetical protein
LTLFLTASGFASFWLSCVVNCRLKLALELENASACGRDEPTSGAFLHVCREAYETATPLQPHEQTFAEYMVGNRNVQEMLNQWEEEASLATHGVECTHAKNKNYTSEHNKPVTFEHQAHKAVLREAPTEFKFDELRG